MEKTAIALLDTLGYKGIWKRAQAEDVLASLEATTSTAEKTGANAIGNFSRKLIEGVRLTDYLPLQLWVRAFSDTIIVGCSAAIAPQCPPARRQEIELLAPGVAILVVSEMVAAIAATAATQRTPMAYRGAIAFGDLAQRSQFLVGPAIDEAAEMEHEPDGAFIVVGPSASALIKNETRDWPLVRDYPVPCKRGVSRMPVVNPTSYSLKPTEYVQSVLRTFTSEESVARKRSNTEAFLRVAALDPVGEKRRAAMRESLIKRIEDATAAAIAQVSKATGADSRT